MLLLSAVLLLWRIVTLQCGHLVAESESMSKQAWWNIKRCIAPHGGCMSQPSCRHIRHCSLPSVSICILSDLTERILSDLTKSNLSDLTKRNSLYIVLWVHHVVCVFISAYQWIRDGMSQHCRLCGSRDWREHFCLSVSLRMLPFVVSIACLFRPPTQHLIFFF